MLSHRIADGAELRPLEPWQADVFATHIDRIRPHLAPWIPLAERVVDEESARAVLQSYADGAAADGKRLYGVWVGDGLAGGVLYRVFDTDQGVCEVGVWIAPEHQGRGLVTAAAAALIDWAVLVRGMPRVEWRCKPTNERSIAVAAKLGFTREGLLRSVFSMNGERYDSEVWSLLAEEWRVRRGG